MYSSGIFILSPEMIFPHPIVVLLDARHEKSTVTNANKGIINLYVHGLSNLEITVLVQSLKSSDVELG